MTGCERLGPTTLCRKKTLFKESYELNPAGFGFFLEARGSWLEAS